MAGEDSFPGKHSPTEGECRKTLHEDQYRQNKPLARRKQERVAAPLTEAILWDAALGYLQRFAASRAMVESVLRRRIARAIRQDVTTADHARPLLVRVIARLIQAGLIEDGVFARQRALSLFHQGKSLSGIAGALAAKGVARAEVAAALDAVKNDHEDAPRKAARLYAKRRRFGPWRPADQRAARRDRDVMAMVRAGHEYALARRIIDGEDEEEG